MSLTLTTPALLFPAISLLLLAYTNRFLVIAQLIRSLHDRYREKPEDSTRAQIKNLRKRVEMTKSMQAFGILSFFSCVLSMSLIFAGVNLIGEISFGLSLLFLLISLGLSFVEISVSIGALKLQLKSFEDKVGHEEK